MTDQVEEIKCQLAVMIQQERIHYQCCDYVSSQHQIITSTEQLLFDTSLTEFENNNQIIVRPYRDWEISEKTSPKSSCVVKSVSVQDVKELHYNYDQSGLNQPIIDQYKQSFGYWRQQMFDWSFMVVENFRIDRLAVALSFNLLDRFVAREIQSPYTPPVTRDDYQLFSMVCLYIASKTVDSFPCKLNIQALVDMSRNFYTKEVIESTELEICNGLNWFLNPPTAIGYCRLMLDLFPSSALKGMSKQMAITTTTLTEIAVSDHFFLTFKPSLVAVAALIHAAHMDGIPNTYIMEFCLNLEDFITVENNADFNAVFLQLEKLYCH